jgi:sodium/potassium-transporting ATPase subunit beta
MPSGKANITSKSSYPQKKGFGSFIYDSDEGTVFGRTAGSWIKITIFYIIFYICLAAFAYTNYKIFETTLSDKSPRWVGKESLIGDNPGVGFRPKPDEDKNADSTLIWFDAKDDRDSSFWYNQLTALVGNGTVPDDAPNAIDCASKVPKENEVCRTLVKEYKWCTKENKFGYGPPHPKPCVAIKLNKIYGWKPVGYGLEYDGDGNPKTFDRAMFDRDLEAEKDMPESLKQTIRKNVGERAGQEDKALHGVYFSCEGENVGDKENMPIAKIGYEPVTQMIPGYFYPYLQQDNYRAPFLFVNFDIPKFSYHVLINIECRAWAKNVHYDKTARLGSVHFELLVDN